MLYRISDLTLKSNVPLVDLQHGYSAEPDLHFELRPAGLKRHATADWFHESLQPGGETWLMIGKLGGDYLLRFADLSDFVIANEMRSIHCFPLEGVPLETISHLLLNHVIPLVLNQRGKVVLHAGAVVLPQGAVAFMGRSGRGKSTLTAALAQRGYPLLTDDGLLLEERGGRLIVIPSYPGLRLWPEMAELFFNSAPQAPAVAHYSEKKLLKLQNTQLPFTSAPVPLRRVYLLAPPEETAGLAEVVITPLPPREAFIETFKHAFQIDNTSRVRLKQGFEAIARAVAEPIYFRLAFPRDVVMLTMVCEAILADVRRADCEGKTYFPCGS
jgi:hypothetical protein